jgi:hypothetical protein
MGGDLFADGRRERPTDASTSQIGSRHPHAAPKQFSKKFAFMLLCVFGSLRGALFSFFYFDTGAYKLVDLIWDKQVPLAELSIYIVAWISVPNESYDFEKSSLSLRRVGLLASRSANAARRTRASFELSMLYTCDLRSAPCLTMIISRTGWRLLKAQALEKRGLMPGDVLYIYTGWGDNWKDPDVEKFYYTKGPGLARRRRAAVSSGKILNGSPSHPPPPFHNGTGQTDRQLSLGRAYRP